MRGPKRVQSRNDAGAHENPSESSLRPEMKRAPRGMASPRNSQQALIRSDSGTESSFCRSKSIRIQKQMASSAAYSYVRCLDYTDSYLDGKE